MTQLSFIEVCAGAGGLSHGFMKAGFTPLLLNDFDKVCCETLKKNHENVEIVCDTMTKLDLQKYHGIDLFMGGVPCQSFSQAGKRKGLQDERGNLILEFCKIVTTLQPKVFLIENVKGVMTHDGGATFRSIMEQLRLTGNYKIHHSVLNANDYGVAQKRERLFIIGTLNDTPFSFPEKENYKPVLKDVLMNVPTSPGIYYPEAKRRIMELVPPGGCWVNLPLDIQMAYMKKSFESGGGKRGIARRLSMNEPSLTLTTSPCQKQTERCHPLETRPLTVREYARIQSFPDSYEFCGSIVQQYKQIGNAVPAYLAEHVAKSVKATLEVIKAQV
jgi:DNA (cytosine-5)-methyltransferase 1